jgi:hypothetical protein
MKRFLFCVFVISFFACEISTTENRIPKVSSFFVSNIDRSTMKISGYDLERKCYVVTASDWLLSKDLLKRKTKESIITEKDSISLRYKYYDNDSTEVVGIELF